MKLQYVVIHLIQVVCITSVIHAGNSSKDIKNCALRFNDNHACACTHSSSFQAVTCENNTVIIQPCYCMYYDTSRNMTLVANCYYSCYSPKKMYVEVNRGTEFNIDVCNQYNFYRVGEFCGNCNDSYGLAAYSYQQISCVPCKNYDYKNWLKYFAVALIPLTIFYVLAVLLSFDVTSSSFSIVLLIA